MIFKKSWTKKYRKCITSPKQGYLQSATKLLRHYHQIEHFGEQKTLPSPPPPLHSKLGCLLFLTGSFNSRTITDGEVEATKRQKEILGKSVSTNFFYLCEKFFHQLAHIIELMQQRENNRFRLKFGPKH